MQAILAAFPGARIEKVRDKLADADGLPVEPPDMPGFASPDADNAATEFAAAGEIGISKGEDHVFGSFVEIASDLGQFV